MGIFDALDISASGLIAERTRMDVTSQNLANAQSSGYRRQDVVLRESGGGFANVLGQAIGASGDSGRGVEVAAVTTDQSEQRRVYDPGHPDADKETGMVAMPNVNPVTEMVNMLQASAAYKAAAEVVSITKDMASTIRNMANRI